ncbi:MAG: deoxyribonuclease IV [Ignavibacteria bacterium]|nr:deoxyribonuclease IV [Ignavibacteria bacterium]
MNPHDQLLGAHTSVQGGVNAAIPLAENLGFTAMQIFTKNNNRWSAPPLKLEDAEAFKAGIAKSSIKFVMAHDSYLINLGAPADEMFNKSVDAMVDELERCEMLGIPQLNFHPGAHLGEGEDFGVKRIAHALNIIHDRTPGFKVKSMIELTAGQGTAIGYKFEHARDIIALVKEQERMSVCIDTAHIFAAGYDIKDPANYEGVIAEFDRIIGLDRLQAFHFNDSKKPLGSRVDRHENIGDGFIGLDGFRNLLNDKRLQHIPKILETPKGKEQLEDLENLARLRRLIEG